MNSNHETKESRTLVLCFDGTADQYNTEITNVVKFFSLLRKDGPKEQLCYYQAGIGTYMDPGLVSPLFEWCAKVLDLAFAWHMDAHIMDGYKFLMKNYRKGDKICIFGFSRGAYTARALGGLLHKVGLLPRDNEAQVPFAYKMYMRTDPTGLGLCSGFKQTYCQSIMVDFMGVWDTVASVGAVISHTLPFTNSNCAVKTFRHALSLDDHRAKFRPRYFHRPTPLEIAEYNSEKGTEMPESDLSKNESITNSFSTTLNPPRKAKKIRDCFKTIKAKIRGKKCVFSKCVNSEKKVTEDPADVLEVWFAGCHSDVGGGAVPNKTANSLSHPSLRWMVREAAASGCDIQFDSAALQRENINLEAESELALCESDALKPIHDELKLHPLWWLLEIVPLQHSWQDGDGIWHCKWGLNFGKGRKIPHPRPNFHSTVRMRMKSSLNYKPRAAWTPDTEIYIH